jgi:hypothetical protein
MSAPFLRVVKGDPSPEETAALVAVLSARASAADDAARPVSTYADPAAAHRALLRIGSGAWVASGWVPGTRTKAEL